MTTILKSIVITLCLFVTWPPAVAHARQPYAPPQDEAARDASFVAFRARLLQAIRDRDVEHIVSIASDDILISFGGNGGLDELRAVLTDLQRQEIWTDFETALTLGGIFREPGVFITPYTYVYKMPEAFDPFEALFVIGTNVLMRDQPSKSGKILTRLSHVLILKNEWEEVNDYQPVKLQNGLTGFVHGDYLRSPIDHRAIFIKTETGWIMTILVAGD